MSKPKITVIGAGSYFFGRPVIWHLATSEYLRNGTLALVDTNPAVLKTMMALARKTFDATNAEVKLIGSTDRREVIKDSDFVVLTFSYRNTHYRGIDCKISEKYGVRMCSGDTIGPGGIFRALREIPVALAVAKDVEELAPNAWVINFVNPTSVLGIALMRYSNVKSFALCDGHHEPHYRLSVLKEVGILPEDAKTIPPEVEAKLDLAVGGVNHCTWMVRFNYDGKNMLPVWREKLIRTVDEEDKLYANKSDYEGRSDAKAKYNARYALMLMDIYGAYPTAISHTKEYVPFWQGKGVLPDEPEPIMVFDADERAKQMANRWAENEEYAAGKKPISEFIETGCSDHATDIIESMWTGLGKSFYINSPNRGAVTNMSDDAFLELRCDVDIHGPRPQPFGEFPRGVLALQNQVLDTHELTAQAAVECDRDILLRAFMTDPIINSISDGKKIMEELLEAERDILPEQWYK